MQGMPTPAAPRLRHGASALAAAPLLLLAALATPTIGRAETAEWRIDPTHSRVLFDVDHAGFSYSIAVVSAPRGRIVFDPATWDGASVEAELPMATLDFGDAEWSRVMQGRRWFDVARFPTARFRSTRIEPIDADTATLHGELTLRDRSVPVTLALRRNAVKRHPITLRRTAGFSATAELDRRDFGLDDTPSMIGHTVRVRIELEAKRAGRAVAGDTPPQAPAGIPTAPTEHDDADPQLE